MTLEQFNALIELTGAEARAQAIYQKYQDDRDSQQIIINAFNSADLARKRARELLVDE